jgi:hypothetical protein
LSIILIHIQPIDEATIQRINEIGGGSRIRTHGGVTLNGFQDRRFRPLSHPSIFELIFIFIIMAAGGQYFCPSMKNAKLKSNSSPFALSVDRSGFLWFRKR